MIIMQVKNRIYLRRFEKTTGLISEDCFRKTFLPPFYAPWLKRTIQMKSITIFFLKFIDKRSQDREILAVFRKPIGTYK